MGHHISKRKCKHCKIFFHPDPRNLRRQHDGAQPPCRQASQAASQRRGLRKPENQASVRDPAHVERVRQWRKDHPGYWRRKAPTVSDTPDALQEPCTLQDLENQVVEGGLEQEALQDTFFVQPTVVIGLLAQLTGFSLQEDIALMARRLQQLGHDILNRSPHNPGGHPHAQTSSLCTQAPQGAPTVQLGGSAAGP